MSIEVGPLSTPEEVEIEAASLTRKLQEAKEEASTPITQRSTQARDILPPNIKRELKRKRTLRRE